MLSFPATILLLSAVLQLPLALATPTPRPVPGLLDGLSDIKDSLSDKIDDITDGLGITDSDDDARVESASDSDADPVAVSQADISAKLNLSCGEQCDALGDVSILTAGGDGAATPRFYIAHDREEDQIVVAHQGTDPHELLSVLNDLKIIQVDANTTTLPDATEGVKMHDGFVDAQERTADAVLEAVQAGLESTGAKKVLVTGHSLGAAIASIDGMMLRMKLDPSIAVTTTVFGLPRVGNKAWADLVDATLGSSFTFVTNQNDPVPLVPPQFINFQHPSNEIHISAVDASGETATAAECPGQENEKCASGNSLLDFSVTNHRGPYFAKISMGNKFCPV